MNSAHANCIAMEFAPAAHAALRHKGTEVPLHLTQRYMGCHVFAALMIRAGSSNLRLTGTHLLPSTPSPQTAVA